MKRREFIRSLGGAVAAAMVPFTAPIEAMPARRCLGVRDILLDCRRTREAPDLLVDEHVRSSLMAMFNAYYRHRQPVREFIVSEDQSKQMKAFAESFFFNKPISAEAANV